MIFIFSFKRFIARSSRMKALMQKRCQNPPQLHHVCYCALVTILKPRTRQSNELKFECIVVMATPSHSFPKLFQLMRKLKKQVEYRNENCGWYACAFPCGNAICLYLKALNFNIRFVKQQYSNCICRDLF